MCVCVCALCPERIYYYIHKNIAPLANETPLVLFFVRNSRFIVIMYLHIRRVCKFHVYAPFFDSPHKSSFYRSISENTILRHTLIIQFNILLYKYKLPASCYCSLQKSINSYRTVY